MNNEQMKNVFILSIVIIAIFGIIDAYQIVPWQVTGLWETYETYVAPFYITLWVVVLASIAMMYYLLKKDKSEAIGLLISGVILLFSGLEDIFFFVLSSNVMPAQMCWLTGWSATTSRFLGEACVTPTSLFLNVILFTVIGWFVLGWFFRQKKW